MAEHTESKVPKKLIPKVYRALGIRSVMNVPLVSDGEVIGLMSISRNKPFTESDLHRFKVISEQVTVILKRKKSEEEIRKYREHLEELVKERTVELKVINEKLQEDITKRKRAEEAHATSNEELKSAYQRLRQTQAELIQAGKMAAMGTLGAGIAHQLNQPLAGIRGFTQIMMMEAGERNPFYEDLRKIEEQTHYMQSIIDNIKSFARQSEFGKEPININEPIEKALQLLSEQLRLHSIRLVKNFSPDLPQVNADTVQLQQVFLNIITNARDAMDVLGEEGKKILTISTRAVATDEFVEATLLDTGCGMEKKELDKIFDPFYTTKSPQRGIGLGLSISYGIIKDHLGFIDVVSKKGGGTAFRIILPTIKAKSCWEMLDCPREKKVSCPVHKEGKGHYCWMVEGTACKNEAEKSGESWTEACKKCQVFRRKAFPPPPRLSLD